MVVVLGGATGYRRRLDGLQRLSSSDRACLCERCDRAWVMSSEEPLLFVARPRGQREHTRMNVAGRCRARKGAIKEGASKLSGDKDDEANHKARDPPTTPQEM